MPNTRGRVLGIGPKREPEGEAHFISMDGPRRREAASTRPTARETNGRWLGTFATTGNKVQEGSAVQIASASVSLVRIRTTWSRPYTKILPSPIFPVFADEVIVSMTLST